MHFVFALTGPRYDRAILSLDSQHPPGAPKLEYFAPKRPVKKWRGGWVRDVFTVPGDAELRGWWMRRVFYYLALVALFVAIGFYIAPNEIVFGQLHSPTAADF